MITIALAEKNAICEKYPDTHFVRTMKKDSKRHHYYMVEAGSAFRYLNSLRGTYKPNNRRKGV